ncbi:MAG: phage portal protein [Dysgonamonadaceae bacterium]|jgi:hypothetical protein|nr:phage portal protein [Dysgonamonadaceae bacterium]
MHNDIDLLKVENVITPFRITDEKDTITNIMTGTGGKQIISQRQGIEVLGWSENPEEILREIKEENAVDATEPSF